MLLNNNKQVVLLTLNGLLQSIVAQLELQVKLFQAVCLQTSLDCNIIIHSLWRLRLKMTKSNSGSNYNKRKWIYFPGNTTGPNQKPSTVQSVLFDYSSIIRSTPSSGSITGFNNFSTNFFLSTNFKFADFQTNQSLNNNFSAKVIQMAKMIKLRQFSL